MYYQDSLSSKDVKEYFYNTKLREKLPRVLLWWPLGVLFLYWAFLLTSRSRQYIIAPITPQGIILIINGYILLYFGMVSVVKWYAPQYRNEFIFVPLFSNQLLNDLIAIISLITYLLLIPFYWIPNLPIDEQSIPLATLGVPAFLPAILMVVVSVTAKSYVFFRVETIAIIDLNKQELIMKGTRVNGKKFLINLSFDEDIQLILQPFEYTLKENMENTVSNNTNVWGVFFVHNNKKSLIFINTKSNSEKYVEELVSLTGWNCITKVQSIYINADKLALFIAR